MTEAVRRRPYSIVLLDEVEKANVAVQEIFYQVFDKGMLQDDKGNEVNFKNTIILLTANVGTDTVMKLCADPDTRPGPEALAEALVRISSRHSNQPCWAASTSFLITHSGTT